MMYLVLPAHLILTIPITVFHFQHYVFMQNVLDPNWRPWLVIYLIFQITVTLIKLYIAILVFRIIIFLVEGKIKQYNERRKPFDFEFYAGIVLLIVLYVAEFWQKFFIALLNCGFVFIPDSRVADSAWMNWYNVLLVETIYIFPITNFFVQIAFLFLFYMLGSMKSSSRKIARDSVALHKKSTKSAEVIKPIQPMMIL